jgi:periplasmic divalent cation tolerance protein
MTDIRLLYVTCKSTDQAQSIAGHLLDHQLIACANILPHMLSIYRWEGAVQHESEVVLILKTTTAQAARVTARVVELHSYHTPCVLELPVAGGHAPYIEWLRGEIKNDSEA